MNDSYLCPVCGFNGLGEPPFNQDNTPSFEICPCCGFEFGFDGGNRKDLFKTYRETWILKGAPWFNPKLKPAQWTLNDQLKNIKV